MERLLTLVIAAATFGLVPVGIDAATSTSQPSSQPAQITLPGVLIADETVELHAKVSGYISRMNVDIGSRVKKGDVLLTIDVPELLDDLHQSEAALETKRARVEALQAKAEQARLNVESARAEANRAVAERQLSDITFNRKQELLTGQAIPPQEFDEAKSQLDVAKAKVAIAQAGVAGAAGAEQAAQADVKAAYADTALAQAEVARAKTLVGYMDIKAPFDGVITRRNADEGAFVRSAAQSAGMPLLVLAKVDRLRLVLDVPEAHAPRVLPGTQVDVEITSLNAPPRRMAVTRTAVAIRPDTHTMATQIDIENTDGHLAPGIYSRAVIRLSAPPANRPGE